MLKAILKAESKQILEGARDFPINMFLLALAILKAILQDTQTQLIAILSVFIGIFLGAQIALISFFSIYSTAYFLVSNLNNLKALSSRRNPPHNE